MGAGSLCSVGGSWGEFRLPGPELRQSSARWWLARGVTFIQVHVGPSGPEPWWYVLERHRAERGEGSAGLPLFAVTLWGAHPPCPFPAALFSQRHCTWPPTCQANTPRCHRRCESRD